MPAFQFPWFVDQVSAHPKSLVEEVRNEIVNMILSAEISPGERIGEPLVAKKLGVSRVPVREALRGLEPTGLVTSKPNNGVFVRKLSQQEIKDLYEMRALYDSFAAKAACRLSSAKHKALISSLKHSLTRMKSASASQDTAMYYQENLLFHWELAKSCGNQMFLESYQVTNQRLHLCRAANLSKTGDRSSSLTEHESIFEAIRSKNGAAAEQITIDHASAALARLYRAQIS